MVDLNPRNEGCVHCKKDLCHHNNVPKVLKLFRQPCIYVSHRHGECNLKESLFDIIKNGAQEPGEKPTVCAGCAAELYSEFCEGCTIRKWPNVGSPVQLTSRQQKIWIELLNKIK